MTGKTHLAAGVSVGTMLLLAEQRAGVSIPAMEQVACMAVCGLGSLLPDIDMPTSMLGSRIRPLAKFFHTVYGHRSFFHSLSAAVILWGVSSWVCRPASCIPTALMLGVLSHLLLDMFNAPGVALFWPADHRVRLGCIKNRSWAEYLILAGFILLDVVLFYVLVREVLTGAVY